MSRLAIFVAVLAMAASLAMAEQESQPQSGSVSAATAYLDASGYNESSAQYVNLLVPTVIEALRQKNSGMSEVCWNEIGKGIRTVLIENQEKFKLDSAQVYARRFTDDELAQLSSFSTSDLGRDYNRATFELIRDEVRRPGAAAPFVEGVQARLNGNANDNTQHGRPITITLRALQGRLSEREITRLSSFFYNGLGEKLLEVNLEVAREVVKDETSVLTSGGAAIGERLRKEGRCP